MADNKLDYFKKKIIEILKAKEEAEVKPEVKKSLDAMEKVFSMFNSNSMGELEKAGYGVGTVRIWRGKKYKKVSANPTKWVRVYEKVDRGAKGSMTRLINKVDSCQSIEELLQFCMSNHALFKDANGVDLPIVDELRKAVDEKKNRLENGDTSSIRPEKKAKKPAEKKPEVDVKNTDDYKKKFKDSYEYTKKIGVNNSKEQLKEQVKLLERDLKENPNNENDPNFMGQYQARLELLADKANEPEKTVEEQDREKRHAKAEIENKINDLIVHQAGFTEKDINNQLDRIHSVRYSPTAFDFDAQVEDLYRDIEAMKDALRRQFNGEDVGQTQARLVEIIKEDSARIRAIAIAQKEFKDGKWKEDYPGAYVFKEDPADSLNLSQKFVDEMKDKKLTEAQKQSLNQLGARVVVNADGHRMSADLVEDTATGKKSLVIEFDGKELKDEQYELIRDFLGLKGYEDDVNSGKYDKKEEPEETEAEKHENRSKAMEGNQNAKKDGAPEEDEAVKKTKEEIKEVNSLLTKYVEDYDGPGGYLRSIKRMTSADGVDSKARTKIRMVRAMEKMHDELTAKGYEVPDVPKDLLDKVNEFVEKHEGKSYWSIPWNDYKVISGINIKKFEEPFQKMLEPLFKKRNELRDLLPKEKEVTKIDVVPGISNQEHANLFTIAVNENSENKEYNNQLMYNGKPFETKGNYSDWGAKEILSEQYKVVKEVGMDFKAQAEYQWNEVNNNKDYYVSGWGIDSALKKLSEKKLAEIAKPSMTDEEFKNWLDNWLEEKPRTAYEMKQQIKRHVTNLAYEAKAKELLEQRQQTKQAIDDVDLPVDPKDMDEAKSIIGRKVNAIAGRGDSYGKSLYRAELKKMIENRIRNNPGLARAMLVYIKDYQKENNVTIFTPQNEIWKQLPKLNENAMNAVMNGKGETQGGQSGELYSGDGVTSVIEDKDAGRYQVFFSGKPDYDTRTLLKQNGFRWAPSIGAWQCYNTGNGERSLARVAEKLGWKKNS